MLRVSPAEAVQRRRPSFDRGLRIQNYYTGRTAPGLRFGAVFVYIAIVRPALACLPIE